MGAQEFYTALDVELLRVQGDEAKVRCFVNPEAHKHDDRNPSASVNVETGAFRCYGCGAAGGPYDAAIACGRTPADAMALLERYELRREDRNGDGPSPLGGGAAGIQRQAGAPSPAKPTLPAPDEAEALSRQQALLERPQAIAKLGELKGWTPEAVKTCGLGFNASSEEHPISFPIRGERGQLVGFVGYQPNRERRNGTTKSKADWGSARDLFRGPEDLPGGTLVLLVEGENDVVSARTLGLPAIGVPGVESWPRYGKKWAQRIAATGLRVVPVPDQDGKGRELMERASVDLLEAGAEVRKPLDLSPFNTEAQDGFDLGDYLTDAARDGEDGILCAADDLAAALDKLPVQAPPPRQESLGESP